MKKTEDASIVHEEAKKKDLSPANDVVLDQPRIIALLEAIEASSEGKKSPKSKKKLESGVQIVDCNTQRRGPRYFDPPEDRGWGTSYNFGKEGHATVNCAAKSTATKQKIPCFLCGSWMHQAKRCGKERDCLICKKVGHDFKKCPELHVGDPICLKCGISGHDMFLCGNYYSLYDLKEIQCYVCMSFGHLCCANTTCPAPTEISCYNCGQTGHTGSACSCLRAETMGDRSAPHNMGMPHKKKKPCTEERAVKTQQQSKHRGGWMVEHHDEISPSKSNRNNWKSPETPSTKVTNIHSCKRKRELSNTKTSTFQKENDYMGDRSAPHGMGMPYSEKKPMTEERAIATQQQSKPMTEERAIATQQQSKPMTEERAIATQQQSKPITEERAIATQQQSKPMTEERAIATQQQSKPMTEERAIATQQQSKPMTEERAIATQQQSKHRDEISASESKRNNWKSPETPSAKVTDIHSFKRKHELSNSKTSTFQKENDYMGDRSAPHGMGMPYNEKKPMTEERAIATQEQPKHRGGWRVEHHDERNSWKSPVTPSTRYTKVHSFSSGKHTPSFKSSNIWKVYDITPRNSGGSRKAFQFSS